MAAVSPPHAKTPPNTMALSAQNMMNTTRTSQGGTGLKGKLASLEEYISVQNEELAAQRQEIEALRADKQNLEHHYHSQLLELKKAMSGDIARLQEEIKKHLGQQKAENSRLQQQVTTLKGEKTSLCQQILGLQRRLQDIEEAIGCE
ncbi:unnamed protein product [Vitrella brassicaformis CCMP3155]|uniref:Uncharacterized protein n=1 Tax=Vitrella brassicaformis (strain CCMP3155) TaxID=1169540 RepID=A0A0G4ERN9_VITBC|nr:unnamed protein product [Vitrella brassicaformis CCMP3155]|mmetsp:Transcript_54074/g.136024  ORF Transcript_54074/g.136024 Transcript_54074/m.136024 type:complete len:147 (-) Transcript_54074:371-811(-)|eukprot:CEL99958.1 unnamed protein product [Vitrella brassicaformis CCMP3155]